MEASALKKFELENHISLVDPQRDGIYIYNKDEQRALLDAKPWRTTPNYFTHVRISAVALIKMVMHARSGGSIEVMGLMQGQIAPHTFIVTDAYPLPVEGTETRVNAQDAAYEYMSAYDSAKQALGRPENVVGWYHSHPGYGCWLSGIDVNTQMTQQNFMDPFLAVVVDPDRTISAGKVDIGAFRTYPEGYKKPKEPASSSAAESAQSTGDSYQSIPLAKIDDFGAHSSQYYSLEIEHFKSTLDSALLDALWNKYWVSTLSQSPLFTNRDYSSAQMQDLAAKIRKTECSVGRRAALLGMASPVGTGTGAEPVGSRKEGMTASSGTSASASGQGGAGRDTRLQNIVRDGNKIASEEITGLLASVLKDRVFNGAATRAGDAPAA